mmetsp:Transcript_82108/g.155945  ORF Transcript_82108/g.155945 Transcript_82108/m.155945 type:complete len:222 (-) Transcript_82108:117-782(-)
MQSLEATESCFTNVLSCISTSLWLPMSVKASAFSAPREMWETKLVGEFSGGGRGSGFSGFSGGYSASDPTSSGVKSWRADAAALRACTASARSWRACTASALRACTAWTTAVRGLSDADFSNWPPFVIRPTAFSFSAEIWRDNIKGEPCASSVSLDSFLSMADCARRCRAVLLGLELNLLPKETYGTCCPLSGNACSVVIVFMTSSKAKTAVLKSCRMSSN